MEEPEWKSTMFTMPDYQIIIVGIWIIYGWIRQGAYSVWCYNIKHINSEIPCIAFLSSRNIITNAIIGGRALWKYVKSLLKGISIVVIFHHVLNLKQKYREVNMIKNIFLLVEFQKEYNCALKQSTFIELNSISMTPHPKWTSNFNCRTEFAHNSTFLRIPHNDSNIGRL